MSNGKLANDGVQSHCGYRASITRKSSSCDVTTQFLLVTRRICTGLSAGIFASETSHTRLEVISIYHDRACRIGYCNPNLLQKRTDGSSTSGRMCSRVPEEKNMYCRCQTYYLVHDIRGVRILPAVGQHTCSIPLSMTTQSGGWLGL